MECFAPKILEFPLQEVLHLPRRYFSLLLAAGLLGLSPVTLPRALPGRSATGHDARPAPDLVKRCFTADRSDQFWVADSTYVPTLDGDRRALSFAYPASDKSKGPESAEVV